MNSLMNSARLVGYNMLIPEAVQALPIHARLLRVANGFQHSDRYRSGPRRNTGDVMHLEHRRTH